MKTFSKVVIISIILFGLTSISYYHNRFYKQTEKVIVFENLENTDLAIIGASWASRNHFDSLLHVKTGRKIVSHGMPGARSSQVYKNLFNESKYVLEASPEYCVIVSGINDMAQMMGAEYYAYHSILTVKLLIANEIKPMVLLLPEVDMEAIYNHVGILSEFRTKSLAKIQGSYSMNPHVLYRRKLIEELKKEGLFDKVILVDFDEITPVYDDKFYRDFAHLNELGKGLLCDLINSEIRRFGKGN